MNEEKLQGVYLIHASKKLSHAQHYIGYSDNIIKRFKSHKNGTGSKLCKAFNENNIEFQLVKIWPNENRTFERKLKNQKNTPRICPICTQGL